MGLEEKIREAISGRLEDRVGLAHCSSAEASGKVSR